MRRCELGRARARDEKAQRTSGGSRGRAEASGGLGWGLGEPAAAAAAAGALSPVDGLAFEALPALRPRGGLKSWGRGEGGVGRGGGSSSSPPLPMALGAHRASARGAGRGRGRGAKGGGGSSKRSGRRGDNFKNWAILRKINKSDKLRTTYVY